jgi:hypothetical protein
MKIYIGKLYQIGCPNIILSVIAYNTYLLYITFESHFSIFLKISSTQKLAGDFGISTLLTSVWNILDVM